jgi:hypothetical protein
VHSSVNGYTTDRQLCPIICVLGLRESRSKMGKHNSGFELRIGSLFMKMRCPTLLPCVNVTIPWPCMAVNHLEAKQTHGVTEGGLIDVWFLG